MAVISRNKLAILICIFIIDLLNTKAAPLNSNEQTTPTLNIAVIGAGAAGLASAKNALEQGHNVVIYEKSGQIGGIWWYTEEIDEDEYGVPIHTPMYHEMR